MHGYRGLEVVAGGDPRQVKSWRQIAEQLPGRASDLNDAQDEG
jgi:hypothetical protein